MMTKPTTAAAWGIQLSKLWTASGQPFPVDPGQLALEVTKTRFKEDPVGVVKPHGVSGIDGMLTRRTRGDWCISYDPYVTAKGRISFTIAHEFGHYLLHRRMRDEFQCGQLAMLDYDSLQAKKIECEANRFASYLLMPADDFRRNVTSQVVTLDTLGQLAAYYGTSLTATTLKWVDITNEAAMLVVVRDEFVFWSYPSVRARKIGAYLPPGTPVPQSALDRAVQGMARDPDSQALVGAGVWHPRWETHESALVSDQYDLAIFLLRFDADSGTHIEEPEVTDAVDFMGARAQGQNWTR